MFFDLNWVLNCIVSFFFGGGNSFVNDNDRFVGGYSFRCFLVGDRCFFLRFHGSV